MGLTLALAGQRGHARIGAGDADHFFLGRLHGGDALGRLQAGLFGLGFEFRSSAFHLFGQFGFGRQLFMGALTAFLFGAGALFGRQTDLGVGFHAGTQFGGFLFDGFQPGHAGLGGSAQRFQPFAVGADGVFGRLGILQRYGSSGSIHGGAVFGQCAHGLRRGRGFRQRRRPWLRFHAGDGFLYGLHFHRGTGRGRRIVGIMQRHQWL
jgi:hypothetical protein